MPQRKCAQKSLKTDQKKTAHNAKRKASLKKTIKDWKGLIQKKNVADAKEKLPAVFADIDRATAKGLIHKNTASRRKSSLARALNAAGKTV